MNKHIHRLVFDRKRGMRVPAAENVRAAGKAAGGQTRARAVAGLTLVSMALTGVAGTRDATSSMNRTIVDTLKGASTFSIARNAGPVWSAARDAGKALQFKVTNPDGLTTQIDQYDNRVIINWDSFNVGADYSVLFNQPKGGSAYNRIWDLNPTVVMGKITANGEVILENTHGVIFGATARVQTGRFVTTALKMTEEAITKGLRANRDGQVMFGGDDASPDGFINIERGAEVKALAGGDVLMIAPRVYNEGTIETPKGQTVLAAGQKVYLYSSLDPAQRGLLVAVDPFASGPAGVNTVENAAKAEYRTVDGKTVDIGTPNDTAGLAMKVNQIVAEQGSINLVGLTVRNNGILTATTAVKGQNGGVYLQAQRSTKGYMDRATPAVAFDPGATPRIAAQLGTVELGSDSVTQVIPSTVQVFNEDKNKFEPPTQTDAETFNQSRIEISGASIRVRGGAQVVAPFGKVSLLAAEDASQSPLLGPSTIFTRDASSIIVEDGARISAAGLRDVLLPMSRNQLEGRLFANELADSPVQRGGVLYRSDVSADARSVVKVANVTGFYNLVGRTAGEISTKAGTVKIQAQGSTVLADGAKIDVSGGSVRYEAGSITGSLLRKGDTLVRLEDAQAGVKYDELISGTGRGVASVQAGYVEGKDGGEIQLFAPQFYIGEGTLKGDVVVGPYQRSGAISSRVDLTKRPDLYGAIRPLGAKLTLGLSEELAWAMDSFTVSGSRARSLGLVSGMDAAAVSQLVNASSAHNQITADMLNKGGIAGLSVYATDLKVTQDANVDLGPTGSFSATVGSQIQVDGQIRAAGGKVSLNAAGDVVLGTGASIDVSGSKLDEMGQAAETVPLDVSGGTVELKAGASVRLSEASRIDVSAGAWRASTGGITTGEAGAIALEANFGKNIVLPGNVTLDGRLSGYDFRSGGKLSITGVPGLSIGQGGQRDDLVLSTAFFSDNGFGSFELGSLGDVNVVAGTVLTPKLKSYLLSAPRLGGRNGSDLFVTTEINDAQRAPINLTLTAVKPSANNRTGYKVGGSVAIGAGAQIDLGVGGSFTANAGLQVHLKQQARLTAHGGAVKLMLTGYHGDTTTDAKSSQDDAGYVQGNEVRLSAGSVIDVSGAAKTLTQTVLGKERVTGTVLGGGSVTLNYNPEKPDSGQRGRVITEAQMVTETGKLDAALINVNGKSAELNLGRGDQRITVSQGAGTVKVGGADGFALMGEVSAKAPDGTVGGGEFIASVSREGKNDLTSNQHPEAQYHAADRVLRVTATQGEVASHAGTYGEGVVSAKQLADAGFDRISLRAEDRVVLDEGTSIGTAVGQKLRSITVSSPALKAEDGGTHELRASHVALGDVNLVAKMGVKTDSLPSSASGRAKLAVNAGLIELYGKSAFQGWQSVDLNATLDKSFGDTRRDGEIRFIGRTFDNNSSALTGYLGFDGDLTLRAGQSYASTLSKFTVQGALGHSNLITAQPSAGASTSATPLSALASLTLQADGITHDGVLRQPFGALTLNAVKNVALGKSSVLSVSGDGVTVPVGTTVNERSWIYTPNPVDLAGLTAPEVQTLNGLPVAKGIEVKGQGISLDNTSVVQAQAGGDLQAWEFIRGAGGSTDTLNRAGLFAVLPNYQYDFAPYDTEIAKSTALNGTKLQAGDKITISTGNSVLAEGTYTLLPSRYALLPGAVLVSAANVGAGGVLNQAISQDDGSVFVSGQRTATGTSLTGGDPRQTFMLESAATFRAKSAYALTSINNLLADRATQLDTLLPSLPGDAGRVSLTAQSAFALLGQLNLAGKGSFSAGQLDITMPSMTVVDDGNTVVNVATGSARVSAQSLNGTHAGSIMLGGTRTGTVEGTTVNVAASMVRVASSSLSAGELVAVATDTVTVDDGVKLTAEGAVSNKANQLTIKGQGAAVVVSQNINTDIRRDLSGVKVTKGTLDIGQATLTGQAVQVDASNSLILHANAAIDAKQFGLGAPRIVVGGAASTAGAVALDGVLLSSIKGAESMQLRSYSSIDFKGSQAFDTRGTDGKPKLRKVVLDAPQLRGLGQSSDTVRVTAQSVVLRNTSGVVPSDETGTSTLAIQAEPVSSDKTTGGITIGEGVQRLAFANSSLTSKGDIVFDGKGKLGTHGDITLAAARVTATSTADHGVDSTAALTVTSAANARTLGERVGAGGTLSFSGQRVVQDGLVDVASGKINITGKGNSTQRRDTVTLTERSVTKAAGWTQAVGKTWTVDAPGGDVTVRALQGDLIWRGQIDVSAPVASNKPDQGQAAGTVTLLANGYNPTDGYRGQLVVGSKASVKGSAGSDRLSASLTVDAQRLSNEPVAGLSDAAQAAVVTHGTLDRLADIAKAGGVRREVDWRIREGAQSLNTELTAQRVFISADAGSLSLGQSHTLLPDGQIAWHKGTIDARAPQGGVVQLAAGQDLIIGADILADSSRIGANGGDILLASADGQVRIHDGVTLSATGDDEQDGRVIVRALRNDDGNLPDELRVNVDPIGPDTKVKAGEFTVEAVRVYTGTKLTAGTNSGTTLGQLSLMADNDDFMASKDVISSALGLGGFVNAHLRSGVEVRSTGNFEVSNDWNLWTAERTGGEPLNLTIRAAGDLNIRGSLSDGFATATRIGVGEELPTEVMAGAAASFRLVAGADLSAANVLKTDANATTGNLRIDASKMVRTTAGSIELAAARDIELKAGTGSSPVQAVVYAAGQRAELPSGQSYASPNEWAQFTNHGGRVSLAAGGSIVAPAAAQLIGNWFHHTAMQYVLDPNEPDFGLPLGGAWTWYSFFDNFKQGVGSFGGGNIDVRAGQTISNLGVVAPTSMRQVRDDSTGVVEARVENGGDISVRAGGDIRGGVYFLGRGDALIQAGGAITKGDSLKSKVPQIGALVGLMDGHVSLQATKDLRLAAIFNPTAMPASRRAGDYGALYFTYTPTTAASALSVSGDVNWALEADNLNDYLDQINRGLGQDALSYQNTNYIASAMVAPPSLALSALSGDTSISANPHTLPLTLFPSSVGQLDMYAGRDIKMSAGLVMADGDASLWPHVGSKDLAALDQTGALRLLLPLANYKVGGPVSSVLHQEDRQVIHIYADRDIGSKQVGYTGTIFNLPKAAEIRAGRDIIELSYTGQQFHDADVTSIEAGRNLIGQNNGTFSSNLGGGGVIALAGPGELQVTAGRQIDLGDAGGVRTVGNKYNNELSADSARITLAAGMAKTLNLDTFTQRFMPAGTPAQAELVTYVKQVLQLGDADLPADPSAAYEQALRYYKDFTRENQIAFADSVVNKAFIQAYLGSGGEYAKTWQAKAQALGVSETAYDSAAFAQFKTDVLMNELKVWGKAAGDVPLSLDPVKNALASAKRKEQYDKAFNAIDLAGLGKGFNFVGDMQFAGSGVQTQGRGDLNTGGINILTPGGGVLVGLNALTTAQLSKAEAKDHGLVTYGGGSIRAMSAGDFLVNAQKAFVVGNGDIMLWSSYGSLDAGRGSNTDVTVPPLVAVRNPDDGSVSFQLPPLTTGSGIGRLKSAEGASVGKVYLNAPNGEIRALDAQIRNEGGEINISSPIVIGGDNIAGKVNGAPPVPSVSVAINVNTSVPSQTAAGAQAAAASQEAKAKDPSSLVTVDLLGMGDDANAPAASSPAPAAGAPAAKAAPDGNPSSASKGEVCDGAGQSKNCSKR